MRKVKASSLNPSLDDLSQELITERPEGDYALYNRSCHANYVYYYWQFDGDFAGSVVELVTQDDGTVYMSNPVDQYETQSWIVGKKEGNIITFQGMQAFDESYDEEYYSAEFFAVVDVEEVYYEEYDYTYLDATLADDQTFQLQINEDGSLTPVKSDISVGAVYYDFDYEEWCWEYISNDNIVIVPQTKVVASAPADAVYEDWNMIVDGEATAVQIAFSDGLCYLKGFSKYAEDVPFVGAVSDGKIVFTSGQYAGPAMSVMRYASYWGITSEEVYDPDYDYTYTDYELADNVEFTYDAEAKVIKCVDASAGMLTNFDDNDMYYGEAWVNPLFNQAVHVAGAVPQTPIFDYFSDYHEYDYPYYIFDIYMPNVDVNNARIDTDKMYLEVTLDNDELYVWYPDEYTDLEEETVLLPYNYSEDLVYVSGTLHEFCLAADDVSVFKFRSVYIDGDEELYSDYLVYKYDDNAVASINSDKQVVSESYVDLAGVRVSTPGAGLYIKTVRYSDGTSANVKVLRK
jgi:hypothetical protein